MSIITIPFHDDMAKAALAREKDCTSRNKKYGEAGDLFYINGLTFVLTQVHRMYLKDVAHQWYKREGFKSSDEFIEYWKMLHPRHGWEPEKLIWLHEFKVRT